MSELQSTKIRDVDLFGKKYEIDVIKSFNENDINSTAYIDGRTHFATSEYFTATQDSPSILISPLQDGEGFIASVKLITQELSIEKIITSYVSIPEMYSNAISSHTLYTNDSYEATLKIEQTQGTDPYIIPKLIIAVKNKQNNTEIIPFVASIAVATEATIQKISPLYLPKNEAETYPYLRFSSDGTTILSCCEGEPCPEVVYLPVHAPNGRLVTTVGDSAFYGCKNIKTLIIPTTIEKIGGYAFSSCTNLSKVIFEGADETDGYSRLNYIANGAFQGCAIEKISLPESVQYIGNWAFAQNNKLKEVYLPKSSASGNLYATVEAFQDSDNIVKLSLPVEVLNQFTAFPEQAPKLANVEELEITVGDKTATEVKITPENLSNLFSSKLRKLVLGEGITDLCIDLDSYTYGNPPEKTAFSGLDIREIYWPTTLKHVEMSLFADPTACPNLESIHITDLDAFSLVRSDEFPNWSPLQRPNVKLYLNGIVVTSVEELDCRSIHYSFADHPYIGYRLLKEVTIKPGCTNIGDYAFSGCNGLTTVTIPNSITGIGDYAFNGCEKLKTIILPASVTDIGAGAFADPVNKKTIRFLGTLEQWLAINVNVHEYSSSYDYPLYSVDKLYINGQLVKDLLVTTEDPSTTLVANKYVFAYYAGLESIEVSNCYFSIGTGSFAYCSNLKSFILDTNAAGSSYPNAFNGCSITKLTTNAGHSVSNYFSFLSDTVQTLIVSTNSYDATVTDSGYFPELEELILCEGIATIDAGAFRNCPKLHKVTLPDTLTTIKEEAFAYCTALTDIKLPANLRFIGCSSFYNCPLENLIIPAKVELIDTAAFCGCNLNAITFDTSAETATGVKVINANAFTGCGPIEVVTIPAAVTEIGFMAFATNNLKKVIIEPRAEYTTMFAQDGAANSAFGYAGENEDLTIEAEADFVLGPLLEQYCLHDVTHIIISGGETDSYGSFTDDIAPNLDTITIKDGSLNESWLDGISKEIITVYAPAGVDFSWMSTGNSASTTKFNFNITSGEVLSLTQLPMDKIAVLNMADSVTEILGRDEEGGFNALSEVNFSKNLKTIGNYAFQGCSGLTAVELPEGLTSLGTGAFADCFNLGTFSIPDSLTSLPNYVLNCAWALYELTLPESITSIGDYALEGTHCTTLKLPTNLKHLGTCALNIYGLSGKFVLPSSIQSMGTTIFGGGGDEIIELEYNIIGLNGNIPLWYGDSSGEGAKPLQVTIGPMVQSLPQNLLQGSHVSCLKIADNSSLLELPSGICQNCKNLSIVEFGINSKISKIGEGAFSGCAKLTSIKLPEHLTELGEGAFSGCDLHNIVLPDDLLNIPLATFDSNINLSYVKLGKNCMELGPYAFGNISPYATFIVPSTLDLVDINGITPNGGSWRDSYLYCGAYKLAEYTATQINFTNCFYNAVLDILDVNGRFVEKTPGIIEVLSTDTGFKYKFGTTVLSEQQLAKLIKFIDNIDLE